MSGRLSGLKEAIKAEREPLQKDPPAVVAAAPSPSPAAPAGSRAKARVGKHAIVGYFSADLSTELNVTAKQRRTTVQAILGEAIDLWLRENGKHPFGER
jgi:hypothetical protein